jgi:hypothetical protein
MSWVIELPPEEGHPEPHAPAVGTTVRTVGRNALEAALRAAPPRPIPAQIRHAGQLARVVSVRFDDAGQARYRLDGIPGEWLPGWLRSPGP